MSSDSFIYVIGVGDSPVKVGVAKNPQGRLYDLQISSPERMSLHHQLAVPARLAKRIETAVHRDLHDSHRRGEWFDVTPDVAAESIERVAVRMVNAEGFGPGAWFDVQRQLPATAALHPAARYGAKLYYVTHYTPGREAARRMGRLRAAAEQANEGAVPVLDWALLNQRHVMWIFDEGQEASVYPQALQALVDGLNALGAYYAEQALSSAA